MYMRLSFLLVFPAIFVYSILNFEIGNRSQISRDLGINIPYWGTTIKYYKNSISSFRGEGDIIAEIELDNDAVEDLKSQITRTKYFDYKKKDLFGADMVEWPKSDTVFYWNVRHHLEKHKLTGLWIYDQKRQVYEFYEPNLSDIPNAGILFSEDYSISAELNPTTRRLRYKRFQW